MGLPDYHRSLGLQVERHDSPLGRWCMARWSPPSGSSLEGLVDEIWYFDGTLARHRERHFPTGRAEIIVHMGPRYRQVTPEGTTGVAFPAACAAGLLLGPDVIEAPAGQSAVLGLRMHPVGAWAVLGLPMDAMLHQTIDLEDVAGGEARRLVDRCAAQGTPAARVLAAAAWVRTRVRSGPATDPAVSWMVREIESRRGGVSIGRLMERTGWSATRMTAAFRREVGLTPKRFARIIRFRHALRLVASKAAPLSRVALEAGYYDQPHLNADFREMSGFAPETYRAAHRYPGSASLAEG